MTRAIAMCAVLLSASLARADADVRPCDEPIDDPIAVPWRDGGFDGLRGGCLRSEIAIDGGGHALIDTPSFYGTLGGDLGASVRAAFSRFELGLAVRVVAATFVQNAVLAKSDVGYGPVTGTAAVALPRPIARSAALVYARLDLPYTRDDLDRSTGAAQLGAALSWFPGARLRVHARVAAIGWYGASVGGSSTRGAVALSTDVGWRAIRWLTASIGADVQGGWYGAGLDHVAVRAGADWRVKGAWRTDVAVGLPLIGVERTDLAFTLGVRRDLE